jgi:integrase/recombinase XerC
VSDPTRRAELLEALRACAVESELGPVVLLRDIDTLAATYAAAAPETALSRRGGYWPTVPPPPAWAEPLEAFTAWQRAAGHAAGTIRTRRAYLDALSRLHPDPWQVGVQDLAAALATPAWRTPETRKSARQTFRRFYAWAALTGRIPTDPAVYLPAVRVPAGRPRPVPGDVLQRAFAAATPEQTLMMELGLLAGLRRGEIARVHGRDVVDGRLRVVGKGGAVRVIPLHPRLLAQLAQVGDRYAFPGQVDGHLSPGWVGKQLGRLLGPGWTGHALRHAAATRWYAVQRDLLAVQILLGHSKPETTARYTQVPDDSLMAAVLGDLG